MNQGRYGLGLDQGVASIGWAVVRLDESGEPSGVERLGVHLFEAGTEGDIASGRDESRAGPRRMARQLRKMYRRRCLRKRRLLRWLQQLGLMPAGDITTPSGRDTLIKTLDEELRKKWEVGADHRQRQLLPYRLRATGLSQRLEPFELGRALYHLAQRRGYLSNRRSDPATAEDDGGASGKKHTEADAGSGDAKSEDGGQVRAAIVELQKQMLGAGCTTLAEYFCTLDPTGTMKDRLRGRWTAREMFLEEFGRLWDEQAKHHPQLNDSIQFFRSEIRHPTRRELKRRKEQGEVPQPRGKHHTERWKDVIHDAIFYQRSLQGAAHLIGRCELVPGERRAPLGHRAAQRFRLLCAVNNLQIELPDYSRRDLSNEERTKLVEALQREGDIAFSKLKQKKGGWFALPKDATFNLERGGEKKLIGNRTEKKCRAVFGDERWDAMGEEERDAVVNDLILFEKPSALARRGRTVYGLSAEAAEKLGDTVLEQAYASFSLAAIRRLLPHLEKNVRLQTAIKTEFGRDDAAERAPLDLLPPVEASLGNQRNPAVTRALTELRKLVNAVVRKYGKPEWIRVELARDLKRARKDRERVSRENRDREKLREDARTMIAEQASVHQAHRGDIERVLLAQECGWICPYTGRSFGMKDIVGKHPQFDVEHIWPLSRSLDDSFLNKTLCFVEENRNVKGNRTPFEAYASSPQRWAEIIDRVKRFRSDAARIKLERFLAEHIPEGFAQRHLAETRKIGAATQAYLMLLYGSGGKANNDGVGYDASGRKRVFCVSGGLTAHLRREWQLSAALAGEENKSRDDHRHHAIDALVVALTNERAVNALQRAAAGATAAGKRLFAAVQPPWEDLVHETQRKADEINVSYRQSRKVNGALHAQSNYSRPTGPNGERRIRKLLGKLTEREVGQIVDARVRRAVETKLAEINLPPFKAFALETNLPRMTNKDGGSTVIRKVRIRVSENPRPVGGKANPGHARHVTSTQGSNHHTRIAKGPDGKWSDEPVALLDVRAASADNAGCAKRPHGGDAFTLAANDFVLMKDGEGVERLYRVLSVSKEDIGLALHTDGRPSTERKNDRIRLRSKQIRECLFRKVTVTYLGEIRRAGG